MVGSVVPPHVQVPKMCDPVGVWTGREWERSQLHIQVEPETVKIVPDCLVSRVGPVQVTVGHSGRLDHQPHGWGCRRRDDLDAFGVKVTAETLEVGAEKHDVAAKVLVGELGVWHCKSQRG